VLLVSHDRAVLDAVARRMLAIEDGELRSYDGGWADYTRRLSERDTPVSDTAPPRKDTAKATKPAPAVPPRPPRRSRELERLEAEIEHKESEVAALERSLADDWANVDAAAAYRRSRDELDALLSRWEAAFDDSSAL
jgi:ATPase subunit of ABC transporter with duplicated ATPase domains